MATHQCGRRLIMTVSVVSQIAGNEGDSFLDHVRGFDGGAPW